MKPRTRGAHDAARLLRDFLLLTILVADLSAPASAAAGICRIAVCAIDRNDSAFDRTLLTQIESDLADEQGIEIVERDKLSEILDEWSQSLLFDPTAGEELVLGRLAGADLICTFKRVSSASGSMGRLRLLSCDGVLIGQRRIDTGMLITPEGVRDVVSWLVAHIRAFRSHPGQSIFLASNRPVARSTFGRDTVLAENLQERIMDSLLMDSGVEVMDREDIDELRAEGELLRQGITGDKNDFRVPMASAEYRELTGVLDRIEGPWLAEVEFRATYTLIDLITERAESFSLNWTGQTLPDSAIRDFVRMISARATIPGETERSNPAVREANVHLLRGVELLRQSGFELPERLDYLDHVEFVNSQHRSPAVISADRCLRLAMSEFEKVLILDQKHDTARFYLAYATDLMKQSPELMARWGMGSSHVHSLYHEFTSIASRPWNPVKLRRLALLKALSFSAASIHDSLPIDQRWNSNPEGDVRAVMEKEIRRAYEDMVRILDPESRRTLDYTARAYMGNHARVNADDARDRVCSILEAVSERIDKSGSTDAAQLAVVLLSDLHLLLRFRKPGSPDMVFGFNKSPDGKSHFPNRKENVQARNALALFPKLGHFKKLWYTTYVDANGSRSADKDLIVTQVARILCEHFHCDPERDLESLRKSVAEQYRYCARIMQFLPVAHLFTPAELENAVRTITIVTDTVIDAVRNEMRTTLTFKRGNAVIATSTEVGLIPISLQSYPLADMSAVGFYKFPNWPIQAIFADSEFLWVGHAPAGMFMHFQPGQSLQTGPWDTSLLALARWRLSDIGDLLDRDTLLSLSPTWHDTGARRSHITNEFITDNILQMTKTQRLNPSPPVTSIVAYGSSIWAGTHGAGLYRLDREGRILHRYSTADSMPSDMVTALAADGDRLWIGVGSQGGGGMGCFEEKSGRFTWLSDAAPSSGVAPVSRCVITSLVPTQEAVWAGTEGGGIRRLDRATWTWDLFALDANNRWSDSVDVLRDAPLRNNGREYEISRVQRVSGRIHATTIFKPRYSEPAGFVSVFDVDSEQWKDLPVRDGAGQSCFSSIAGSESRMWIGTVMPIAFFHRGLTATLGISEHDQSDGSWRRYMPMNDSDFPYAGSIDHVSEMRGINSLLYHGNMLIACTGQKLIVIRLSP